MRVPAPPSSSAAVERPGVELRRQEELAFMATHDALTGLANRALVLDRLEQMLVRSRRSKALVAALFIDLDNFKQVNDTLGHDAGDELLRAVAARLDGVVRATDTLGRLGGDEFVVIAEIAKISRSRRAPSSSPSGCSKRSSSPSRSQGEGIARAA